MKPLEVIETPYSMIKIHYDLSPESPRQWDNFGVMACAHGRYSLGDTDGQRTLWRTLDTHSEKWNRADRERLGELSPTNPYHLRPLVDLFQKHNIGLLHDLYLYDHGGITMNTTGFACPWDSGKVGVIFAPYEVIRRELGRKQVTRAIKQQTLHILRDEVETYDRYLRGDVYGYELCDKLTGDVTESCYGYYDQEECIKAALAHAQAVA